MRARFMSTLSVVGVLGLLLCVPLAAQDVPQEQPAEEEGLVQVPAQELEQELESAQSDPAQEGQGSEEPEAAEPATTEAPESGADERSIENMPKTASPLALVALIGASSVAGGLGLRRFRRR